ncbi:MULTISPECIES: ATP-binding protein [unclassified Corynebacterium]|uniref:ATP-binding protein n=1 Tax=unclassified Corynebacterium TaxID=2624378 RepID=UPI001D0EBD0A|nr:MULTISPECIES: ATP-binding protein [unclassified Corynebacterium]
MRNPFKATLGATPPELVGRDEVVENFGYALDDGPGAHERISLVVGPRGIGKTVLLNAFEDEAASKRGWLVLSETATPGFVERLRNRVVRLLAPTRKRTLRGIQGAIFGVGGGVSWESTALADSSYTLREALKDLFTDRREADERVGQEHTGVLITLDEMHHQRGEEIVEFGAMIQHLVREGEEIAVAMAGIPSAIKPLLADGTSANPVTFLRRAERIELDRVADSEARTALVQPLRDLGIEWEDAAMDAAVSACQGYPFMIQLVGQYAFRKRTGDLISFEAARDGVELARRKLGQLVHDPALADLSDVDRTFLLLMARDDGPSTTAEIAQRLGKGDSYAWNYRRRLLDAEMIVESGPGEVDFALPYLREHAMSAVVRPRS